MFLFHYRRPDSRRDKLLMIFPLTFLVGHMYIYIAKIDQFYTSTDSLNAQGWPLGNLLDAARGLRELIEAEADSIEENSTMSQAVVDAIVDAGLFRLMVPASLGGFEADVDTIIDVSEALSYADGSVGWSYCQNCSVMAYAAYLEKDFAEKACGSRAAAGMFAPLGMAERTPDGFKVSGNYLFGSGSGHAEYMGGAALVTENGESHTWKGKLTLMPSIPSTGFHMGRAVSPCTPQVCPVPIRVLLESSFSTMSPRL